jgi:acyl-[acyl carrier protein]--UDP-N-acetylglucosamine O-acyltransferase
MGSAVHQGSVVGGLVMSSMNTSIKGEVPPFVKLMGPTGRIMGLNEKGLERAEILGEWALDYLSQLPRVYDGWLPTGTPGGAKRIVADWLEARNER